jgi:hypothetical protein
METPIASPEPQVTPPLPVPESYFWRIAQGFVVTVLTLSAFLIISIFGPEWQDGRFQSYVSLLLSTKTSWIFAPLIGYASLALLFLLSAPMKWAQKFWVRLGIYTGALLGCSSPFWPCWHWETPPGWRC